MKNILLIGGGHTHVSVIRALSGKLPDTSSITLISESRKMPYSGMLPGYIAGHYATSECHIDLHNLCEKYNVRFLQQKVVTIDSAKKLISTNNGRKYEYDIASINIGGDPNTNYLSGVKEWGLPIKPIENFLKIIEEFFEDALTKPVTEELHVRIIGGGASSVEVVLALRYKSKKLGLDNIKFSLITDKTDILPTHPMPVRRKFHFLLLQNDIMTIYSTKVTRIEKNFIFNDQNEKLDSDLSILANGISAVSWPIESGLPSDSRGFIQTDNTLLVKGTEELFATGDSATIESYSYPKSGVYAVKQAATLASNICNLINSKPLHTYEPQTHSLALISAGKKTAVASSKFFYAHGTWIWHLKNYIDKSFINKFRT